MVLQDPSDQLDMMVKKEKREREEILVRGALRVKRGYLELQVQLDPKEIQV